MIFELIEFPYSLFIFKLLAIEHIQNGMQKTEGTMKTTEIISDEVIHCKYLQTKLHIAAFNGRSYLYKFSNFSHSIWWQMKSQHQEEINLAVRNLGEAFV